MFTLATMQRAYCSRPDLPGVTHHTKLVCTALLCLGIAACGGGGSSDVASDPVPPPVVSEPTPDSGVFLDSPVINIGYKTETLEGVTSSLGEYEFLRGESVTFFIGSLEFPSAKASRTVTGRRKKSGERVSGDCSPDKRQEPKRNCAFRTLWLTPGWCC